MHFPTFLSFALSLTTASAAAVAVSPYTFYLKTRTHPGEDITKNGLYLASYHVSAGAGDAVFLGKDRALKALLNDTVPQFDFNTPDLAFVMDIRSEFYSQWSSVGIAFTQPTRGFAIENSTLVWNEEQFNGWLVCDWSHGVPQLYWKNHFSFQNAPSSCASVDLVTEKV